MTTRERIPMSWKRQAVRTFVAWLGMAFGNAANADDSGDLFEAKIRPVLVETCLRCHGETKTSAGLRVDSRDALLKGGESGPAIVPGKPEESLLIQAIRRVDDADVSAMPPEKEKALRAEQVADFVRWIGNGAVWPADTAKFVATKHWAYEPVRSPKIPEVRDKAWPKGDIDAFILARQEASGVTHAPPADKRTLIRRATFDLTGLPPAPSEIDAFLADDSPDAFKTVVDRLLASNAYGERWGQHWLDVVRYADTAGETADFPVPLAWRYRNYVIDSIRNDKPYDRFLREQIAGDILAEQQDPSRYAELATATGYLAISRRFGFDSENYHHLTIQDTLDTLGQGVLGLSVGCARCHDHKFDAISTRDYYALYGIFDSSRYAFPGSEQKQQVRSMLPLVPPGESLPRWQAQQAEWLALAARSGDRTEKGPGSVLRSLHDIDGDFELQAPAAGGSNGVLVSPWLYQGAIAVTNSAQSPFRNLHPFGKVGVAIAEGATPYSIAQAIYPKRSAKLDKQVYVNIDFRVTRPTSAKVSGRHGLAIGPNAGPAVAEIMIGAEGLAVVVGGVEHKCGPIRPDVWTNLQLRIDWESRTLAGRFASPGAAVEIVAVPLAADSASIDRVEFHNVGGLDAARPGIEFDNLGIQREPIAEVSTKPTGPTLADGPSEAEVLNRQWTAIAGIDGDFELQAENTPPGAPWSPGPNSVVTLSKQAQSPFRNVLSEGNLGIHLPNRAEYDGFGQTLKLGEIGFDQPLHASFEFRCADQKNGGHGSWRYYLGHGPGFSAAVELFFNGSQFFQRNGDAIEPAASIAIGDWYQVQLTIDRKGRTYRGMLATEKGKSAFSGKLATQWDGTIDYTFIDSYGHISGVRPALDADNFSIGDTPLPTIETGPNTSASVALNEHREQAAKIRARLALLRSESEKAKRELESRLIDGPFAMTYGVVEGTPHDVRIQKRGEPDQPGEVVARGFIKAISGTNAAAPGPNGSGRLELANWLTSADNPLTARVMVNRIWQHHFGRGIVKTPNDFGVRGLPPTHPELLDFLASEFIKRGWSLKAMHRLIMLSATYQQQASTTGSDLYDGFTRRRLSAEEVRDSILAVTGQLDPNGGQGHPFPSPITWRFTQHGPFIAVYGHDKRSVYLMRQRLKRHPFLALFDGADPNTTTADRLTTTVPTQALFFMNDPFVHEKTGRWGSKLLASHPLEPERIEAAWRGAFGRSPSDDERRDAAEFLRVYRLELESSKAGDVEAKAWGALLRSLIGSNEFLYVD